MLREMRNAEFQSPGFSQRRRQALTLSNEPRQKQAFA